MDIRPVTWDNGCSEAARSGRSERPLTHLSANSEGGPAAMMAHARSLVTPAGVI